MPDHSFGLPPRCDWISPGLFRIRVYRDRCPCSNISNFEAPHLCKWRIPCVLRSVLHGLPQASRAYRIINAHQHIKLDLLGRAEWQCRISHETVQFHLPIQRQCDRRVQCASFWTECVLWPCSVISSSSFWSTLRNRPMFEALEPSNHQGSLVFMIDFGPDTPPCVFLVKGKVTMGGVLACSL